mmetsp:Transcript_41376/g.124933  ORF Transcript_41376/g.124933 Transcript_41376/m.124933 type:complete len:298 (-) Transcript_41376:474-1367(-)
MHEAHALLDDAAKRTQGRGAAQQTLRGKASGGCRLARRRRGLGALLLQRGSAPRGLRGLGAEEAFAGRDFLNLNLQSRRHFQRCAFRASQLRLGRGPQILALPQSLHGLLFSSQALLLEFGAFFARVGERRAEIAALLPHRRRWRGRARPGIVSARAHRSAPSATRDRALHDAFRDALRLLLRPELTARLAQFGSEGLRTSSLLLAADLQRSQGLAFAPIVGHQGKGQGGAGPAAASRSGGSIGPDGRGARRRRGPWRRHRRRCDRPGSSSTSSGRGRLGRISRWRLGRLQRSRGPR